RELELALAQTDLARRAAGPPVRPRVDALPQRTFEGRLSLLGELPVDSLPDGRFPVRARVPNPDGLQRPGMAAHVKVLTQSTSVAGRALRGPVRWLRLVWWRMWA